VRREIAPQEPGPRATEAAQRAPELVDEVRALERRLAREDAGPLRGPFRAFRAGREHH